MGDEPWPEGLDLIANVITSQQEDTALAWIENQPWESVSSRPGARKVQQYGYAYTYGPAKRKPMSLGPFPEPLMTLVRALQNQGLINRLPSQAIINAYDPGQGIAAHVDDPYVFGDEIVAISLLGNVQMDFKHPNSGQTLPLWVPKRSLMRMSGPARYDWRHAIAPRLADQHGTQKIQRERRISITLRSLR